MELGGAAVLQAPREGGSVYTVIPQLEPGQARQVPRSLLKVVVESTESTLTNSSEGPFSDPSLALPAVEHELPEELDFLALQHEALEFSPGLAPIEPPVAIPPTFRPSGNSLSDSPKEASAGTAAVILPPSEVAQQAPVILVTPVPIQPGTNDLERMAVRRTT